MAYAAVVNLPHRAPRNIFLRRLRLALAALLLLLAGWSWRAPAAADPAAPAPPAAPSPAPARPPPPGPPPLPTGQKLAFVPLEGAIMPWTASSFNARLKRAVADGATLVVVPIDSPGGEVGSVLSICHTIKAAPATVVGWVDTQAYSGGAFAAAACERIHMKPGGAIGDCAPVAPGTPLPPTERAKVLSPLLDEFRDSAARHYAHGSAGQTDHDDFALFHAMCVLDVEVWQVRQPATGEVRLVNQADKAVLVDGADPAGVRPGLPATLAGGGDGQELLGVAAPKVTLGMAPAERGKWQALRRVHDGGTLLTLRSGLAGEIGLSRGEVADEAAMLALLQPSAVHHYPHGWSLSAAYWLTHPLLRFVLVLGFILCFYVEMSSPGLGVFGVLAAVCAVLLFGGPMLLGLAGWWHVLLFLVGVALVLVEVFLLPHHGVLLATGILLMLAGIVMAVVPGGVGGVSADANLDRFLWSLASVVFAVLLAVPGIWLLSRFVGELPVFRRLVLSRNSEAATLLAPEAAGLAPVAVGMEGTVTGTGLRPGGRVDFGGPEPLSVVSVSGWIEPGARVRVVEAEPNRVAVEKVG